MDHHPSESFPFEQSKLKLGSGGSGHVFLGRSVHDPAHLVAIKKRYQHANEREISIPRDEEEHIIMHRCCNHPNTMQLLAAACFREHTHFAMELMTSDLGLELKWGLRCNAPQVAFIMHEVLQGVAHLHSQGLVHRDVKACNILLQRCAASPAGIRVVIGDFGVAHFVTEAVRSSINYRGTRVYHAPEVLLSRVRLEDSTAIDMWAVGCLMFELLCEGKQLVEGGTALEVLHKLFDGMGTDLPSYPKQVRAARFLSDLPPTVPPCALELLQMLLQLDPKNRVTAPEALLHPFITAYAPCVADSPITLRGYEKFNAEQFTFKPVLQRVNTDVRGGGGGNGSSQENAGEGDHLRHQGHSHIHFASSMQHDMSANSSNSSSIHLSQQRAQNSQHLTLSNLRTNALFNSSGASQQRFASSQRALFASPQSCATLPKASATNPQPPAFQLVSPTPARRTLTFDSPIRQINMNDAAIED